MSAGDTVFSARGMMESEHALTWSDSFAVGHDELDWEHRGLVDAINHVEAAVRQRKGPEEIAEALSMLREKAVRHIQDENALLRQIKSGEFEPPRSHLSAPHFLKAMAESALDQHLAKHDELLARLDAIIAGPAEALYDSLKTWFVDHAIKHDLPLKAIFQAV